MSNDSFWDEFISYISDKLTSMSFNTWFKNAKLHEKTEDTITLEVESTYYKDYVKEYYMDLMEEAAKAITNKEYLIEVITPSEIKDNNVQKSPIINNIDDTIDNIDELEYKNANSNLKKDLTFDNFVVGDSNRLAQTVALQVAEHPGTIYNPLFIYGRSGLGKTHLMNAIGNYIVDNSNKSVLYIRSEQFITDFTDISRRGANEDNLDLVKHFKDKYRNIDVLIIDDIQQLGGANQTQSEFFETFNFLHDLNKQIIISSDRSPDDLKVLELRLRTRFAWGLSVNIMPPDYELRLNILKNKIAGQEISRLTDDDVLEYVANNLDSDVRHLESSILRLTAYYTIYKPPRINLEFAKDALKDILTSTMYLTNNIAKIIKAVAEYYDITEDALKSKKRTANINNARQIAMYICKMTTDETIQRIGLEFNRDHATVLHSCDKIEEEYKTSEDIRKQIKEIKEKIIS
ncbi:MAG TPA: chromosomal replication initiator protein DnaA [Bacilli bacterium]|nr:chromosomal replication initiator protein DnaA [Bacilli bacterium]